MVGGISSAMKSIKGSTDMGYRRATLISSDNPKASVRIALSDNGDVFLKVMLGKASSETVHLTKGAVNEDILYHFGEIVDTFEADAPIGHVVKVDGVEYVVTKSSCGCEGCAFEHSSRKCPDIFCLGDDRLDGFDVQFKEK